MATPWTTRKGLSLIWNIATCAVIVGVVLFLAVRTASPAAFIVVGVVLVILAFLVRRYRSMRRGATAGDVKTVRRPKES